MLCWIQIEGRPWRDTDVVLLEKVPGGSRSMGAGISDASDGHNVKSKDVIDIPQSCDAITSTWETILKDNRSSFMIDPYGSPNHDALPPTT